MHIRTFRNLKGASRAGFSVVALAVAGAAALPAFMGHSAAAGQVTQRYIKMSSAISAATNATYEIGFTTASTGTISGFVVDFCDDSPLVGLNTCTTPPGSFSVGASPSVTVAGFGTNGTWTTGSLNSNRTLYLTGTNSNSIPAGTSGTLTLSGVTNPTGVNHSFYARIYVYNTSGTSASAYTVASPGTYQDAGGAALSTAQNVDVTSKIQESLSFCVYTQSCGTGSSVSLGDTNGVLSTSGVFIDQNTKYTISTNATNNAVVRFKAGLPASGANTIASVTPGAGPSAAAASTPGTSQFGICTYMSSGSGLTFPTLYNDGTHSCSASGAPASSGTSSPSNAGSVTSYFAFDTNAAASTFGSQLATQAPGLPGTGVVAMMANTSPTQQAGIYTNTFDFIATGTY